MADVNRSMLERVPVREQDPKVRATNFDEVCIGYQEEEAIAESQRCLNCKNPQCVTGCPVSIHIPEFIHAVKEKDFSRAYDVISESSSLPAVCGRVCPQERQCEGKCIRGKKGDPVSIGKLERFVADWARENGKKMHCAARKTGKKVAVIGAGPAGLTCAGDLAKMGYDVTIFEALHKAGGVLVYGIPEFRLPKDRPHSLLFFIFYHSSYKNVKNFSQNCIKISEEHYNKIYYTDTTIHRIKGNGKAITWEPNADVAAPMMRKEFSISRPVKSARLYATARGIYEMSINGRQVSNDYLNPGWTDYRFRLSYNVYDVSALIQQGNNAVGAVLGKGWYTGNWGYYTQWMDPYGTDISLLAKLVINYQDGSREVIVTDGTWQYTDDGPIVENGLLDGEDYDARREIYEWDKPQYDASKWHQVKIYNPLDSKVVLQPYVGKPVRVDTVCTAIKLTEPLPHHFIYDIGQNVAGIPQIKIKGKRGQRVTLKYAEMLYPEVIPTDPVPPYTREQYEQMRGQMYLDNYRGALSTDNYICSGKGVEIYEPRFTSHGFRYIEVTGLDEAPSLEDVKVLVLNSLQEHTATYATSDTLVGASGATSSQCRRTVRSAMSDVDGQEMLRYLHGRQVTTAMSSPSLTDGYTRCVTINHRSEDFPRYVHYGSVQLIQTTIMPVPDGQMQVS